MRVPLLHLEEAEGIDESGNERSTVVPHDSPDQHMDRERAQQKGQKPYDVVGQHRIPGGRINRQRKQADAEEVFSKRKGIPLGMKDVRIEQ
jgi:hypothetical protein